MRTKKEEYFQYLAKNFPGLLIRQPLFYNWVNSLRFNLQVGETDTDEYFKEVQRRSSTLFEAAFAPEDTLFLVLMDYKWKRSKIRFFNYVFRQINDLIKKEISYTKARGLYEPNDNSDIRNIAILKVKADRINHNNILAAIGHSDFPPRQPRLDNYRALTSKEIYFINADKNIIFNMYDDRGLDIIASEIDILRPLYQNYNDWLLDYDRVTIDQKFKEKTAYNKN